MNLGNKEYAIKCLQKVVYLDLMDSEAIGKLIELQSEETDMDELELPK